MRNHSKTRAGTVPLRPDISLVLLASLAACADDLVPEASTGGENGRVVTEASGNGELTTRVDASDRERWVYFSFVSRAEVTPDDPENDGDWHLGLQRFSIITNGGVSGSGGAAVAILSGATLADVTVAPVDGYVEDRPDADDDDTVVDSAFAEGGGWYDYDPSDNTLSPKQIVYVFRSGDGRHYKLEILDYYDTAGTGAHPSFVWAEL